jgi:ABC-type branched-subunit amino acid transport system ATPase component
MPEGRNVFPKISVRENLLMGVCQDAAGATAEAQLAGVFEAFPRLKERVRQLAGSMSGGEQAMLPIGRESASREPRSARSVLREAIGRRRIESWQRTSMRSN